MSNFNYCNIDNRYSHKSQIKIQYNYICNLNICFVFCLQRLIFKRVQYEKATCAQKLCASIYCFGLHCFYSFYF